AQPALLRRGEEPAAADDARLDLAVPDVADGHGRHLDALLLHLQDDVEVLLAAAADAEEADVDALQGAVDAAGAGGGQGQGAGADGRRLEEVPAVDVRFRHGEGPSYGRWRGVTRGAAVGPDRCCG